MTTELRQDPIVGRWVIVRTEDFLTPDDYDQEDNGPNDESSPFVYHREHMTPPEVAVIRDEGTLPNSPGWNVRVVPNKFPALRIEGELDKYAEGVYDISNGVGAHEVIVETPDPVKQFADFSIDEIQNIIRMYHERYIALARDRRFKYIMIFKNFGESAGTSVYHSHSQLIALPMIPQVVQEKLNGAKQYMRTNGHSVYAELIRQEYADKERIVSENDDFVSFCPFVPRYSFETWIYPKNRESKFMDLSGDEQRELARILKETLSRIKSCLSDPSYNFYLHIAPVNTHFEESFLWHIEIVPKLTRISGFEWGTGFYVVHTPPEEAAKYLRAESYQEG